jgi:hypothetical protein
VKFSFRFPQSAASDATRAQRRRSLILACAGIAVLPLLWRGTSCGHDFDFHLQSWMEVVHHWREGVLSPHWVASANYGAGEPRFVFYPPVSWLLGGSLGVLLPWSSVPVVLTLIALMASGFSLNALARKYMPADAAAIASCLYMLNPYSLFVAYERTAYGELLAAAAIPLVILFTLRGRSSVVPLALTIAAIWLTNAPAAVTACYALALIAVVAAIAQRTWRPILRAVAAVPLGLGLAAIYIVPAAYERRWVEIARAIGPGMNVQDSFLFARTGEPFHDQVLRTASWIAVTLLLATAAAATLAFRRRATAAARHIWWTMLLLAAAVLFLLLPISATIWQQAPELEFLQFPWRWLLVLSAALTIFTGLALEGRFRHATSRRAILQRALVVLAAVVALSAFAARRYWQPCDQEDAVWAQIDTFHSTGFEGTDEYTPTGADNSSIQQGLPEVRVLKSPTAGAVENSLLPNPDYVPDPAAEIPATIQLNHWNSEHKQFTLQLAAPAYAVLRLVDYPAWRVRLNGQLVTTRPRRDDGLMVIPTPAGASTIDVRYAATPDVWCGRFISLISLLIVILLTLTIRKASLNRQVS